MSQGWLVFWAIVGGLVWSCGYVAHCRFRPYAACRKCDRRGRFSSRSGRSWRRCPRCKGSGERVRFGRRVWTWLSGVRKSAIG